MSGAQLILLSLGLSVGLAAAGLALLGRWERRLGDPALRERLWGALLYVSVLPALLVPLSLLLPAPVVVVPGLAGGAALSVDAVPAAGAGPGLSPDTAVLGGLVLAAALSFLRATDLGRRAIALHRLATGARDAGPDVVRKISVAAGRLGARVPSVCCSDAIPTPLLTGFFRPLLLLPETVAGPAAEAICAHELAHLRRGDHRTVWIEEALLILCAANPLLPWIRARRAAAREEACDALALSGASDTARRLYARALVEAIRKTPSSPVPALTFTSAKRSFAMLRLKAILEPAPPAEPRLRRTALIAAGFATAAAASASIAVAAQREPVVTTAQEAAAAEADRTIRNPDWARHPMPAYPAAALDAGVNAGSGQVRCMAQPDGRLSSCLVLSETPGGLGFGAAAVQAAGNARLAAHQLAEVREPTPVVFTVRFRIAG